MQEDRVMFQDLLIKRRERRKKAHIISDNTQFLGLYSTFERVPMGFKRRNKAYANERKALVGVGVFELKKGGIFNNLRKVLYKKKFLFCPNIQ